MDEAKKEMTKHIMTASIMAVALIIAVWIIGAFMSGIARDYLRVQVAREDYQIFGYEGIVYRLNKLTGRTDVLFPGNEGAIFIPVWQMNPGNMDRSAMTAEEQENWNQIARQLAAYIGQMSKIAKAQPKSS